MKKLITVAVCALVVLAAISSCKKDRSEPYDPYKQLEIDEQLIVDYIADSIPAQRDAQYGVYYVIEEQGSGEEVTDNSIITVKYTGKILNGPKFDSSNSYKDVLGGLINGWRIGLPYIQKGGKIRLFIPSGYAYGPYGSRNIPPNAVLDFEIELLDVSNPN